MWGWRRRWKGDKRRKRLIGVGQGRKEARQERRVLRRGEETKAREMSLREERRLKLEF